jgi:hypothetical protein
VKPAGRARRILVAVLLACAAVTAANVLASAQARREPMTWDEVAERALAQLTAEERQSGVLYLDRRELPAGSTLEIDGRETPIRRPSAMAFVDRVPQANWGHSCRYMLIDLESGHIESIEAQFPPFLRSVPPSLHMVHKGETVPDWTIAKP